MITWVSLAAAFTGVIILSAPIVRFGVDAVFQLAGL